MVNGIEIEVDESVNYVRGHLNTARASAKPYDEMSFMSGGERIVINEAHVLFANGAPPTRGSGS
jgi:hypothetical protein